MIALDYRNAVLGEIAKMMREIANNTKSKQGKWVFNEGETQSLTLEPKPCKEFGRLQKWLEKYTDTKLKENSVYCVRLFGKRATYGESGRRSYIDTNASMCVSMLNQLRKLRNSGDNVKVKYRTIDDIDTKTSTYYETECYGTRHVVAEVVVSTPKGKNKGCVTIMV
jgi:hypothetical protein